VIQLKIKTFVFAVIKLFALSLTFASPVIATQSPVEFVVPDTTLKVSGFASPNALVSIFDGNSLIGTAVANDRARFEKLFTALNPGLRKLKLEYVDKSGRKSSAITGTVSVAFQRETAVEYFLPPTLDVAPRSVVESDIVTFQGSSIPTSQVALVVDGGNTVLRPQVDGEGNYSISLATDGFFIGEHPFSAKSTFANNTSYETDKTNFSVQPSPSKQSQNEQPESLDPPIITEPKDGYEAESEDVLIKGTAAPNQQIIIFLDGEPIGSTFSNNSGDWFFNLKIFSSLQRIQAITCVGSDCSDFSNQVEIEFTGEFGKCSSFRFALDDYRFWGISANDGIELGVAQISGKQPYEALLSWGDDVEERFSTSEQGGFQLQHVYRSIGQFNGTITLEDDEGCVFSRNFSVDVQPRKIKAVDFWWTAPAMLTVGFAFLLRFKQTP
jgi:hypothetical protein